MLAEELTVLDADTPLWNSVRPLLDVALRLEQTTEPSIWHGWNKKQIDLFLQRLPAHCALLVGVWETLPADEEADLPEHDILVSGFVCEVVRGEVCSLSTFETLNDASLPSIQDLEPGFEHARALLRVVGNQIAPVAWALFTDKATWDEWVFAEGEAGGLNDKGELLAELARQGRCVLMGTQTTHTI